MEKTKDKPLICKIAGGIIKTCGVCLSAYAILAIINNYIECHKTSVTLIAKRDTELYKLRQSIVDRIESNKEANKDSDRVGAVAVDNAVGENSDD